MPTDEGFWTLEGYRPCGATCQLACLDSPHSPLEATGALTSSGGKRSLNRVCLWQVQPLSQKGRRDFVGGGLGGCDKELMRLWMFLFTSEGGRFAGEAGTRLTVRTPGDDGGGPQEMMVGGPRSTASEKKGSLAAPC